ncbi:MAG: CotH kinase family protein [Oscillospiraceae bacterium]|nr:CotH kinase family protein [Oscillospiraceae bacterium]
MKRTLSLLVLTALLLTGCSGTGTQTSTPETTARSEEASAGSDAETTEEPRKFDTGDSMPVLSITTVDTDALDFVTEPVAAHVAEQIASWTPHYEMPPAPYYEACTLTLTDGENVVFSDIAADVKVRGNWTTTYAKKPLRLKFAEKQSFGDLHGGAGFKNWLLLASYKDGSMLRDQTAFGIAQDLFADYGLYAPDCELVEVEINGHYWGVYLLTDQLQVNENRVDITKNPKDYTGTDIGYLLEFDGYYTDEDALHSFAVDYADNAPLLPFEGDETPEDTVCPLGDGKNPAFKETGFSIKSDINSQEQHDFIAAYMNNVYRLLYAAAYEDKAMRFNADFTALEDAPDLTPQEAVELAIDVESLAAMYILSEVTCDADIYWSSFFMDVDFGENGSKKLTFEAPWDFDSALGNKDRVNNGKGFYAASIVPDVNDSYDAVNPWLTVLMQEDWYRDIIRKQWTNAYDAGVFERAGEQILTETETHENALLRNVQRWDSLAHNEASTELSRKAAQCRTPMEAAEYLAEWLADLVEFLNGYWHE